MADTIAEPSRYETPAARKGGMRVKNLRCNNQIEATPLAGTTVTGWIKNTSARVSRLIDSDSTPTSVDEMVYIKAVYSSGTPLMYLINNMTATSGEARALRARMELAAASSSTAAGYAVHAQGIAYASKYAGTINALYAEAIAKGTSTVTTLRGAFIAADSENTPTAIGNMTGCHIRCKTSVAVTTNYYGLIVENEKFGSGVAMDAMLQFKTTTWTAGEAIATNVIEIATTGKVTNTIYTSTPTTYFLKFSATTGVGMETGSLKDSDAADIKCDAYIRVIGSTTAYYIALYDTTN
jgi:hypothetical protein